MTLVTRLDGETPRTLGVALAVCLLVAPVATAAAWAVPMAQSDAALAGPIEALAAPHADSGLLSGVILVARGERILLERAYGFASWELRTPVAASSRFGIASITKVLTETVVELLVASGRMDLDAPVESYLPGFPKGPRGGVPTVGHLLAHRAGVPHRVTDSIDETQPLRTADIVERVRATGLLFEPGSERLYSSAGFTCLARVIEIIEGRPFETVLAERIFAPAGMTSATSESGQRLMPHRALPHRLGADAGQIVVKSSAYKDLRFLTGAGSVFATARDLWRFVRALHDGVFGEELWERTFDGDATTWHGWAGRTSGYEASVDVLPSEDLVLIFLSNLQSATNWQLRERIQGLLLGRDAAAIPLPPQVAGPFEETQALLGVYGPAEITLVAGQLFRGDNEFYPITGSRYYIPASGTIMRFRRDATGKVDALIAASGGGRESVLLRAGE